MVARSCTEIVSRQPNEEIVIGPHIVVKVVSTTDKQTVLSVTRPSDVTLFTLEQVERQPSLVPWFRRGVDVMV